MLKVHGVPAGCKIRIRTTITRASPAFHESLPALGALESKLPVGKHGARPLIDKASGEVAELFRLPGFG